MFGAVGQHFFAERRLAVVAVASALPPDAAQPLKRLKLDQEVREAALRCTWQRNALLLRVKFLVSSHLATPRLGVRAAGSPVSESEWRRLIQMRTGHVSAK